MKTISNNLFTFHTTIQQSVLLEYEISFSKNQENKMKTGSDFSIYIFHNKKEKKNNRIIGYDFIKKVEKLINENIDDSNFGIKELGDSFHLSASQLYRRLKIMTGMAPNNFIRKIKMDKACKLLTSTHLNISEIAYTVGFNDPNYFSRTFQKEYGVSPRSFRNA